MKHHKARVWSHAKPIVSAHWPTHFAQMRRSDRLREWYHAMLRRAKEEGIVTYVSNLYDTYFEGGRDHRVHKPSVLALPYFEGDYWPGEAENLLSNISEEARVAGKSKNAKVHADFALRVVCVRCHGLVAPHQLHDQQRHCLLLHRRHAM